MQLSHITPEMGREAPASGTREAREAPGSDKQDGGFPKAQEKARQSTERPRSGEGHDSVKQPSGNKLHSEVADEPLKKSIGDKLDTDAGESVGERIRLLDSEGKEIPLDEIEGLTPKELLALLGEDGRIELALPDGETLLFKPEELTLEALNQGELPLEKLPLEALGPVVGDSEGREFELWSPTPVAGQQSPGAGVSSALQGLSANGEVGGAVKQGARAELFAALQQAMAGKQEGSAQGSDKRSEALRLAALDVGSESSSRNRNGEGDFLNVLQQAGGRNAELRDPGMGLRQYTTSLETPVQQQRQWSEQVAGKIAWIAGKHIQSADIHLNPPEMGPIDVRVQVSNEQAAVTVHSQNPAVREMLELSSHRLREMLEDSGLDLSQFDVSDQAAGGEHANDEGDEGNQRGATGERNGLVSQDGEAVNTGEMQIQWSGGVDTYA